MVHNDGTAEVTVWGSLALWGGVRAEWSGGEGWCVAGGLRLKKGVPETPGEGPWRSAQHAGHLGSETRSGCWAKSRQMAERVVGGTLLYTALDQRADSRSPGLQRPHVAPLVFRKGTANASGATPGSGIELTYGNSSQVFSLVNPKSKSPLSHGTIHPWELSLSI